MTKIEKLKQENKILKHKLEIASIWMKKEIIDQMQCISEWNIDEKIKKKIWLFFWDIMLLNIPLSIIENIISAEILYYNLKQNPETDWLSVIASYHKALDTIIELFITKWFRKFAKKSDNVQRKQNDLLEKHLETVVHKWYTLGAWRLFHIIKLIKTWNELFEYWKCFKEYLDKSEYISNVLLNNKFYENFEKVINSEVLWKKRHEWHINFEETKIARDLLIWRLEDRNCIIYELIKSQSIDF